MPRRAALPACLLLGGCDPTINIYGALFPAWVLCLIAGAVGVLVLRPVFARTGLERNMAPLLIVYPALGILIACLLWLGFFR